MWITVLVLCFLPVAGAQIEQVEVFPGLYQQEMELPALPVVVPRTLPGTGEPGIAPGGEVLGWERATWNALPFPPPLPNSQNIGQICRAPGNQTATQATLPANSGSHLYRQADAIDRARDAYRPCCTQPELRDRVACAEQAWTTALDDFCEEEFGIKTAHYHCCKKQGDERRRCFVGAVPALTLPLRRQLSLSPITVSTMEAVCSPNTTVNHRLPGFWLFRSLQSCCTYKSLVQKERCGKRQEKKFPDMMCAEQHQSWVDSAQCCNQTRTERIGCFQTHYLGHVRSV